jgi:hypothetical protein
MMTEKTINCWICDHFQRYDRGPEPQSCAGECRLNTPPPYLYQEFNGPLEYRIQYWPCINDSTRFWCGRFQRSLETNLPPLPPTEFGYCAEDFNLPDDWLTFWMNPWSKKILPGYVDSPEKGVSCWNCDHFQLYNIDYSPILGECRARPFGEYQYIGLMTVPETIGYRTSLAFQVYPSPCVWCAQWERTMNTDLPVIDWENCCSAV